MPWEDLEHEIRHPVRDAKLFREGTFRSKDIGNDIRFVMGKLLKPPKGQEGSMVTQSVRWAKPPWTLEKAKKWFAEHKEELSIKSASQEERLSPLSPGWDYFQLIFKTDKDPDPGKVSGHAITWSEIPGRKMKFQRGCFDKTIIERVQKGKVPLVDTHNIHSIDNILGSLSDARDEEGGLWIDAQLSSVERAQQARTLIKEGHLSSFSIGATINSHHMEKNIQISTEVTLWEVSLVSFPADPNARIATILSGNDNLSRLAAHINSMPAALQQELSSMLELSALQTGTTALQSHPTHKQLMQKMRLLEQELEI